MTYKAAATWNILCDQGKTLERTVTYKVAGVPFDNTGWQARMMARRNFNSSPVLDLSSTTSGISLGGANGQIYLLVSAIVMEGLVGEYIYDLELYDPLDLTVVIGVARGKINVRQEVTYV